MPLRYVQSLLPQSQIKVCPHKVGHAPLACVVIIRINSSGMVLRFLPSGAKGMPSMETVVCLKASMRNNTGDLFTIHNSVYNTQHCVQYHHRFNTMGGISMAIVQEAKIKDIT